MRGDTSSKATHRNCSTDRFGRSDSYRTTNRDPHTACCGGSISSAEAVDIRRGSPTFGRHVAVELSGENRRQLFIPRGFAHGFVVLSEEALFQYKCDNYYAPQSEGAIAWNDPQIGIDWRIDPANVILSEKDSRHPRLDEAPELFDYNTDYYAQR